MISITATFLTILTLHTGLLLAQSIAPQSVNSAATKMSQSNGSISFTLGELCVLSSIDKNGNYLGSGFSTGAFLSTVNIIEIDSKKLKISIFPNPVNDLLKIRLNESIIGQFVISIIDTKGKEIYSGKYSGISTDIGINLAMLSTGIYFMTVKDCNNMILGSYKIIKQ